MAEENKEKGLNRDLEDVTIPSLTVYKKGKRLKASYFKAFSRFSFCFELCYILSCVIFVVLFL